MCGAMAKRMYPSDSQHVTCEPEAQDVQIFCKPALGLQIFSMTDFITKKVIRKM